jgi:hypothetical protein
MNRYMVLIRLALVLWTIAITWKHLIEVQFIGLNATLHLKSLPTQSGDAPYHRN